MSMFCLVLNGIAPPRHIFRIISLNSIQAMIPSLSVNSRRLTGYTSTLEFFKNDPEREKQTKAKSEQCVFTSVYLRRSFSVCLFVSILFYFIDHSCDLIQSADYSYVKVMATWLVLSRPYLIGRAVFLHVGQFCLYNYLVIWLFRACPERSSNSW